MHFSIDPEEIKAEIAHLGHAVTNILNIKHYRTKQPLSILLNVLLQIANKLGLLKKKVFMNLQPAPNNKDIFDVEFLQQCKIRFEPPKHTRDIAQCANCQRYGHTKNFCYLKPRCVKCAGEHSTSQCPRKERSGDVRCVLCGGNHPANYEGSTVYKDLQKTTNPFGRNNILTLLNFNKHYTHSLASLMPKSPNKISVIPPLKSRTTT
jgi:hypothetical protein